MTPKRAPSRTWDCPVCGDTYLGGDAGPHACDYGAALLPRVDGREPCWDGSDADEREERDDE